MFYASRAVFPYLISLSETFSRFLSPSTWACPRFNDAGVRNGKMWAKKHRQQPAARISLSVAFASIISTTLCSLFSAFFFAPIISSQHSNLIRCRYHIVIVSAASLDDAKMSTEKMKEEKKVSSHFTFQLHREQRTFNTRSTELLCASEQPKKS